MNECRRDAMCRAAHAVKIESVDYRMWDDGGTETLGSAWTEAFFGGRSRMRALEGYL